ncbi:unnamed protein product, partial [Rotaria sp. Silwood1]
MMKTHYFVDFGIRGVALRLLFKLLPKLTHEQLYEIAQILYVDGPNECQIWTLEIYKWIDFGIRGVALRLLFKLLPKLTHEQLYEIA